MKVGLIVGSLRKDSWNRKVAEVVKELFPAEVEANFIDITNLPLYNQDLDGENVHEEYKKVREDIEKYDAYIFFFRHNGHAQNDRAQFYISSGAYYYREILAAG